ncbi:MAG: Trk system potassium transporter TrkA [Planctomycetes bacterium]|nr:Trk system potassium transporter TrkA [Planctomycetota bacterium]
MRIVILGAGTVGTWIADLLCQRRHSVTVIDIDPAHTRRINDELDVRVVTGSGSQSSVLFQADVLGADVFLALCGVDEVNLVSASMAKALGVRRSVARVYAPVFRDLSTFDYQRHFQIDRLLSLEQLAAMELARGIRNPGSVLMDTFARGEMEVAEVIVTAGAPVLEAPLKDLGVPPRVRVGSIYREGRMWIAGAEDQMQEGDHAMLIGDHEMVDDVKKMFQPKPGPKQVVVIAGGGETGYHLARVLEGDHFAVTVMESDPQRCAYLATHLQNATVLNVDASRRRVLEEERIGSADYFVATTGDDEDNIMLGVEARETGAKSILAVVQRPDYATLVNKLGIDRAVSPRDVMARQVLGLLNTGPVISRSRLPGGDVEVLELEVREGAPATEHVLANLALPKHCLIGAVVHEEFFRVPAADDRLQAGDTVLALVDGPAVEETVRMFRIGG